MSWYAEVILSHIIIEKQSDMERRHGSPRIVTSHSFFILTTSQSGLCHWVPWGASGERVMVMAEKKRNCCLAICPEKCLWVVCCKQKSVDYSVYPFLFRGNKRTSGINEFTVECWLKKGRFFLFASLWEVKTVNWWVVCLSAMFDDDDGEEEEIIM